MIVGSGLLARAFALHAAVTPQCWFYAAGVSNSACTDEREFERERARLADALRSASGAPAFVYFSTCSADDPAPCWPNIDFVECTRTFGSDVPKVSASAWPSTRS